MKTKSCLGILAGLCLLSSCGLSTTSSREFRPVSASAESPSPTVSRADLEFHVSFCGDGDSTTIPILLDADHETSDHLHLLVNASGPPSSPLHLDKFEVVTPEGRTHDLLDGKPRTLSFSSHKPYAASFQSEPREFEVVEGRKVTVNLEARYRGQPIKLTREFAGTHVKDLEVITPFHYVIGFLYASL